MENLKLQELTVRESQAIDGGSLFLIALGVLAIEVGLCAICYQIGRD